MKSQDNETLLHEGKFLSGVLDGNKQGTSEERMAEFLGRGGGEKNQIYPFIFLSNEKNDKFCRNKFENRFAAW